MSCAAGSSPVELELGVPGEHNRQNAAAALAALELAGVPRAEAEDAIARFTGRGGGSSSSASGAASPSTTTTATTRPSSRRRSARRGR